MTKEEIADYMKSMKTTCIYKAILLGEFLLERFIDDEEEELVITTFYNGYRSL